MSTKLKIKEWIAHGKTKYVVDLRSVKRGKHFFKSEDLAKKFLAAEKLDLELHGTTGAMSALDRHEVHAAKEKLAGSGMTFNEAIDVALKLARPKQPTLLPKAQGVFEHEKLKLGCSKNYTDKMNCILRSMERFRPGKHVHEWMKEDVSLWLDTKLNLTTRHYALQDARNFFVFGLEMGFTNFNPCDGIRDVDLPEMPKGILTPAQAKVLIETCLRLDKKLVRYFADQLFGFMREDEADAFTKAQEFDTYVYVPPGKIGLERFPEINETWKAWRAVCKKPDYHPIVNRRRRFESVREAAKAEMVKQKLVKPDWWFPDNACRHSCSSYGSVKFGTMKAAEWSGHTEATQKKHYRRPIPKHVADEYWAILPAVKKKKAG